MDQIVSLWLLRNYPQLQKSDVTLPSRCTFCSCAVLSSLLFMSINEYTFALALLISSVEQPIFLKPTILLKDAAAPWQHQILMLQCWDLVFIPLHSSGLPEILFPQYLEERKKRWKGAGGETLPPTSSPQSNEISFLPCATQSSPPTQWPTSWRPWGHGRAVFLAFCGRIKFLN